MSILNITEESGEVNTKKLVQRQLGHCDFSRNNFLFTLIPLHGTKKSSLNVFAEWRNQ